MKRLVFLPALLVVCAAAAFIAGHQSSSQPEMSRCVDYTDHVVDSPLCALKPGPMLVHGSLHPEPMYRTYYGGYGSFRAGSRAWGGDYRPLSGHLYQTAEALQPPPVNLETEPQPYVVSRSR